VIKVPKIGLEDVKKAAEKFLVKYHPSLNLPIPIEDIVELKMGIGLSAVNGIKQLLDIDAFINRNFTEIFVDSFSFDKHIPRTRFSIAHEIGHLVLHREWYETIGPSSIEEYFDFTNGLDEEPYKYIERQASTFAGLILVPRSKLIKLFIERLGKLPREEDPELLKGIIQDLPAIFNVSETPILWRLQDEKIIKRVPLY
jgi:Zn-dependent peptidase ImmA (M78 family)